MYLRVAIFWSILAFTVQISPALATNNDVPSYALILAQYGLAHALTTNLTGGLASMDAVVERVRRECASAASEAPPSGLSQAQKLVREMGGMLLVALLHNDHRVVRHFVRLIAPLRGSVKFTSMVRSEAVKLEELSSITTPDLCGDVRAWAGSHFAILPSGAIRFDKQLTLDEGGSTWSDLKIAKLYGDSRTRLLAWRIEALQKQFELREGKRALRAFFALVRAVFGERCTQGKLCLPFQVLTPSEIEHGQVGD